jgi:hypothetical protein
MCSQSVRVIVAVCYRDKKRGCGGGYEIKLENNVAEEHPLTHCELSLCVNLLAAQLVTKMNHKPRADICLNRQTLSNKRHPG